MRNGLIGLVLLVGSVGMGMAAQDTDISNREVRDPKRLETYLEANASDAETRVAALEVSSTNTSASSITSGNLAIARMTNALPSAGSYIGGNIPVAAITNAAGSVGASIGGNIPVAAITNAAGSVGASIGGNIPLVAITNAITDATGTLTTNDVLVSGGGTNRWILAPIGGKLIVVSITAL